MSRQTRTGAGAPGSRRGAAEAPVPSFSRILKPLAAARGAGKHSEHELLAQLSYDAEVSAKEEGLRRFWQLHRLPGVPEPLVTSPKARRYRTSSKRRVAFVRGKVNFFMGDKMAARAPSVLSSVLEPTEHGEVYAALRSKLSHPAFRLLATHLNYLIIRGSYAERAVVFNVDELSGAMVRKIKMITDQLRELPVIAFFAYLDPTRSDYHFESRRPDESITFKKISGPDQLRVSFETCRYSYHPTSFSQVNESIVPKLLNRARELLSPDSREHLLDLYCGYGLFSHYLAPAYKSVVGVDAEGPSIRAATANCRVNPSAIPKRFLAARIDSEFVSLSLRRPGTREVVLLDPPRNGPLPGVITALAQRRPHKVLHVFCDVDQRPPALQQWRAGGYHVASVVPLDMFPGSTNLEVLVLLTLDPNTPSP
jgi:tRNA/tmRNA/rRNA uracil-C5-methylase (TrmA/RlmC/RlmD family)